MQFGHRPQFRMPQQTPLQQQGEVGFDGKMLRKAMARKTVDYNPSVLKYLENRIWQRDYRDMRALQPDLLYTQMLTPPQSMIDNPINCVTGKFIRAALNKDPRPVFCVCWTPDGRRLITGASSGEFTLWNGLTFNFETILQAHNSAVRAMIWSHNEQWMLTGDDKGFIKYWQANMNNVHMFQGHLETIRGLSFSPTDAKFVSCSDDRKVRIFDFVTSKEENILEGHGSDVKCVDWHPHKALIISGSKDSQQPIILWDARNAKKLTTLHAHKNTCTDLKWNQFNGNWLISSSRDHLCKLFDLRNLKEEVQSFRGHKKEASTVAWHPIYEKLFVSGGNDGSMFFWMCGSEKEVGTIDEAHESIIWDLSWHPLGHMLVSGSNDRSTRFWTRHRPGDTVNDKADEAPKVERVTGIIFRNIDIPDGSVALPGLGLDQEALDQSVEQGETEEQEQMMSPGALTETVQPPPPPPLQPQPPQQQQQQQQLQQQQIQSIKKELVIPGLDFEEDDGKKRKAPYAKPIPKEFEKAWKSNKPIQNSQTNDINQFQMMQQQSSGLSVTPLMNLMSNSISSSNQPIPLMAQSITALPSLMASNMDTFNSNSNSIDTNEIKTEFWSENVDNDMENNNNNNNNKYNNRRYNNRNNMATFDDYNDDEDNNNNFGRQQRQQTQKRSQSSYNNNNNNNRSNNNNKNNNNMNINDIDAQEFRNRFNDINYDYDNNNDYDDNDYEGNGNDNYDDDNNEGNNSDKKDNNNGFDNDYNDEDNNNQSDDNNVTNDDVQPKGKRVRIMSAGNNRNYQQNNFNNNRNNNNRKVGGGGGSGGGGVGGGGYNNNRNRMNNNKNFNNNRRGGNNNNANSSNNYNNSGNNNNNRY